MFAKNSSELFAQAVKIEETHPKEALKLYEQVLAEDSKHAAANINAGTICYNAHQYDKAEVYYRAAIVIDPSYALAYFDLGNVLDETGRILDAIQSYHDAIKIHPAYADAHYNLALTYERVSQPTKALNHWKAYIKLDVSSPWSLHARKQIARIVGSSKLFLIRENLKPRRTKRRAKLTLVHANQ